MEAVIKITTNRIYFEQFPSLGDRADVVEIKKAWEAAIYKAIEDAGFTAETEIGVGYDPAVQTFVEIRARDECDCDDESPDCECEAKSELPQLITLCEKYAAIVAEKAIEAGYDAAAAKSDEIVKTSESMIKRKVGTGIFICLRDIELLGRMSDGEFAVAFPGQSRRERIARPIHHIELLLGCLDCYPPAIELLPSVLAECCACYGRIESSEEALEFFASENLQAFAEGKNNQNHKGKSDGKKHKD